MGIRVSDTELLKADNTTVTADSYDNYKNNILAVSTVVGSSSKGGRKRK